MLEFQNISFYRIMTAGYISAETVNAIKPKEFLKDLSYDDCLQYDKSMKDELRELLENDILREKLYCIEKIDRELSCGITDALSIVINYVKGASIEVKRLVEKIGVEKFAADYIMCSKSTLLNLYFIDCNNFQQIYQASEDIYQELLQYYKLHSFDCSESSYSNESYNNYLNLSGNGFSLNDHIRIDDDALSLENLDCKKYILFLYSLDYEDLKKYTQFFFDLCSEYKVYKRFTNIIERIGIRNFYVNYLFAYEQKLMAIPNFGLKCIYELERIKQNIIDYVIEQYEVETSDTDNEVIIEEEVKTFAHLSLRDRIGNAQYKLLYSKLHQLVSTASIRARNAINNYKGDFIEDFVEKEMSINCLKNVGKKTEKEISSIIDEIKIILSSFENREFSAEEIFIMNRSNHYGPMLDDYAKEYYLQHNRLPMLHILGKCFESLRRNRSFLVLNDVAPLYKSMEGNSLESVGEKYALSRERVRQICKKEYSDLFTSGKESVALRSYYNTLSIPEDWEYILKELQTKRIWNLDELEDFLSQEKTDINTHALCMILSILFPDAYAIVGRSPMPVASEKTIWRNTYLIDRKLTDAFDFDKMLHTVDDLINDSVGKITRSSQELLQDTFFSSWKKYEYLLVDDLAYTISNILIKERDLIPSIDNMFTLEGKKKEDTGDVLYRLLSSYGKPMDLFCLFVIIERDFPKKYKGPNSLRSIVNRDPRMCMVGTDNLVTLIEWKNVQIGSIRDLIVSFLQKYKEPQHIKDIVDHICSIRNTTENSIRATMSSGDQFQQFEGAYYGLSDKDYSGWESEKYSRQNLIDFEMFLQEHKHFPFYPSDNRKEMDLNRWWKRVIKNTFNSSYLNNEINRIKTTYGQLPKIKSDYMWYAKYDAYIEFIRQNGRKPDIWRTDEIELAKWFDKAYHDIMDEKLSRDKELKFIELSKLI